METGINRIGCIRETEMQKAGGRMFLPVQGAETLKAAVRMVTLAPETKKRTLREKTLSAVSETEKLPLTEKADTAVRKIRNRTLLGEAFTAVREAANRALPEKARMAARHPKKPSPRWKGFRPAALPCG